MRAFGFLIALVVGAIFTTEASAAAIQYSINLGTISSGSSVATANTENHPEGNTLTAFDYYASGTLATKTAITFTFTANKVLDSYYHFETGTYNGLNAGLTLASPDSSASNSLILSPTLIPVLLSASFTRTEEGSMLGDLTGTITIKNLTASMQDFGARFTSLITQIGCLPNTIKVTATVSSVPVPPALLMFGSGLLGLAGFASKKRKI